MKPFDVDVVAPNVGVNAAPVLAANDVPVTVSEPVAYPVRVAVIIHVELFKGGMLVTVTKPVLLIDTKPDEVAVPAHE